MDRNAIALHVLPSIITAEGSGSVNGETRVRCVEASFDWADAFLEEVSRQGGDLSEFLRSPAIG